MTPFAKIRPAKPEDRPWLYRVCLETGDSGQDGTHLYPDDPDALGRMYVGPYLEYAPELAYVLESGGVPRGYALGALESERFYRRYLEEWLPGLQREFPEPTGPREGWTPAQEIHWEYHHPQVHYPEAFRPYPAHVHIDLVAELQGAGWGGRMMAMLLIALADAGAPGVHLAMSKTNLRALAFYRKLGFEEIDRTDGTGGGALFMGRSL